NGEYPHVGVPSPEECHCGGDVGVDALRGSSTPLLTFLRLKKKSDSSLYPTGSTITDCNPILSSPSSRSYSSGWKPSIGQESIFSIAHTVSKAPSERYN